MSIVQALVTNLVVQTAAGIRPPNAQEGVIGAAVTSALPGGGGLNMQGLIFNDLILKSRTGQSAFLGSTPVKPPGGPIVVTPTLPPPPPPDPKDTPARLDALKKQADGLEEKIAELAAASAETDKTHAARLEALEKQGADQTELLKRIDERLAKIEASMSSSKSKA